jgi:iron-sulfur cluster assembly accessory protein
MIKRTLSILSRNAPLIITSSAWDKMENILSKNKDYAFLFSAKGGGCNGFNYNLETIARNNYDELTEEKIKPIVLTEDKIKLILDPSSEMLVLGTTINYINEDYSKNIYESRFVYTPQKDKATSCGCGISFSPKDM